MRQASCDTVWDSVSLTGLCISLFLISPVLPSPFCNPLSCLFVFPQHAPGVPRILVGNRLHLAFKRQVPTEQARAYAEKNGMTFFEVSPLCNFNVIESFTELSRIVLMRHGMEKFWRPNRGESSSSVCSLIHQHLFKKRSILSAILDGNPTNTVEIFGFRLLGDVGRLAWSA